MCLLPYVLLWRQRFRTAAHRWARGLGRPSPKNTTFGFRMPPHLAHGGTTNSATPADSSTLPSGRRGSSSGDLSDCVSPPGNSTSPSGRFSLPGACQAMENSRQNFGMEIARLDTNLAPEQQLGSSDPKINSMVSKAKQLFSCDNSRAPSGACCAHDPTRWAAWR